MSAEIWTGAISCTRKTKMCKKEALHRTDAALLFALSSLSERQPPAPLVEYLVQGKAPEQNTIYVGSEVVFRSNAVMYDSGNFRGLLI